MIKLEGNIQPESSISGSEDATIMMKRGGKATYMLFGSPPADRHHNPAFDWRDDTILLGVEAR